MMVPACWLQSAIVALTFAHLFQRYIRPCASSSLDSRLGHSARWLRTLDNVDLEFRRVMDPQHLVGVEVGLLNSSDFQGDLTVKRRRDTKDDRALDLRSNGIGIDGNATIYRADDPMDANLSSPRHFDFCDLRHAGRKDELKRDAAAETLRQRLFPTSFFSNQLEDRLGAGGLVEQSSPIDD